MMHRKISMRLASKGVEDFKEGEDTWQLSGVFRIDGFLWGRAQYIALQWVMTQMAVQVFTLSIVHVSRCWVNSWQHSEVPA